MVADNTRRILFPHFVCRGTAVEYASCVAKKKVHCLEGAAIKIKEARILETQVSNIRTPKVVKSLGQ